MPSKSKYQMVVIGSGPSGQRAAVQAAKLKKSVLVIERDWVGGSCLHTGTIPSKTLREAALETTSERTAAFDEVMRRKESVIEAEGQLILKQLERNHVEYVQGRASFTGPHRICVETPMQCTEVEADFVVIATGTRPARPAEIPFNDTTIFDSDTILSLRRCPTSLGVLGAGVIGCEYASIFARMGVKVTLIDQRERLLSWMDPEITEALQKQFAASGIELCLASKTRDIQSVEEGKRAQVRIGENLRTFDALLICMGRLGNTEALGLARAGLVATERSLVGVNEFYQTAVPHIYAVGDVIGSPGLASASSEQGRLASAHAFSVHGGSFPEAFPYGIYTIPEISSVGAQESDLKKRGVEYVVGRAQYKELARGKILGDEHGFLKLLFDAKTRRVLGVQVFGSQATELVHIGQAAFILGAGIDFFINNVFNYPTLAEAYKVAAYNAYNQLRPA